MKKIFPLLLAFIVAVFVSNVTLAQSFESAHEAVAHMKVGWNLGNTLDSHSGDTLSMWIERWTRRTPADYETAWGQPVTQPELFPMFAEAGFNAIRVPVTWYAHMSDDGTVDAAWMQRVHEVVDYVLDTGMYCILNVHHDTGSANTVWIKADGETYAAVRDRYAALWTNIANEFIDYDEHLLFEAYNEMLDSYNSWCFASFNTAAHYDAAVAADAYEALSGYCQTFVDAVRATGGNNTTRNLVLCTYAGASSEGSWNSHLLDPLTVMEYPNDVEQGHIIYEVHAYPELPTSSSLMTTTQQTFTKIKDNLMSKGAPVIVGELGTANADDYVDNNALMLDFMEQYVALAKDYGIACFYWNSLSDQADRSVPQWTKPDLTEAVLRGYYGDSYVLGGIKEVRAATMAADDAIYDLQGKRVAQPTKGIYIRGGKKFVVR